MNYLIKIDDQGMRHVLRIEDTTDTHITITNPLFNCFGCVFTSYGRKRTITKKWLSKRSFVPMSPELSKKYDNIKSGDYTEVLF